MKRLFLGLFLCFPCQWLAAGGRGVDGCCCFPNSGTDSPSGSTRQFGFASPTECSSEGWGWWETHMLSRRTQQRPPWCSFIAPPSPLLCLFLFISDCGHSSPALYFLFFWFTYHRFPSSRVSVHTEMFHRPTVGWTASPSLLPCPCLNHQSHGPV